MLEVGQPFLLRERPTRTQQSAVLGTQAKTEEEGETKARAVVEPSRSIDAIVQAALLLPPHR